MRIGGGEVKNVVHKGHFESHELSQGFLHIELVLETSVLSRTHVNSNTFVSFAEAKPNLLELPVS